MSSVAESSSAVRAELDAVGGAIALATHAVAHDPAELGSQLVGRLIEVQQPGLVRFRAAVAEQAVLWPLLPGLTAPGGPLLGSVAARQATAAAPLAGAGDVVVQALAVGRGGRSLVVGYQDGEVHALEMETRARLWARRHDPDVHSLAVDPRSGVIVTGSADGTVRVVDPAGGDDLGALGRHDAEVLRVAVAAGGRLVVSASLDGDIRVWDLDGRKEIGRLPGPGPFALAPDGRRVFAVADGDVHAFDLETLSGSVAIADQPNLLAIGVTPDGARLVTVAHAAGSSSDAPDVELNRVVLTVHDLGGDEVPSVGTFTEPATGVYQFNWATLAMSPDAGYAVTGSLTGKVLLWDLAHVEQPAVLSAHSAQVLAVAMTPDARRILTGSRDGTVRAWDPERAQQRPHVAAHRGEVNGIAVTPDGRRAVTVASDGSIAVWELLPEIGGRALPWTDGPCWCVAFSDDGARAVVGGSDGLVVALDVESGAQTARHGLPGGHVMQVGCSATGDEVWAVATDGTRARWDLTADTALEGPAAVGGTPLFGLAVTPDGGRFIAGTPDGLVRIGHPAEAGSGRAVGSHAARVRSAAITPDGRLAITGDASGEIAVWDVEGLAARAVVAAHEGPVIALALTPDGRLAASAGWDARVALWDLSTGARLASFSAEGRLTSVALSANGRLCVAGEQSGRVHALLVNRPDGEREAAAAPSAAVETEAPAAGGEPDLAQVRAYAGRCERLLAGDPVNAEIAGSLASAYATLTTLLGAEGTAAWIGYAIRARDLLHGLQAAGVPPPADALELLQTVESTLDEAAEALGSQFDNAPIPPDSLHEREPSGPTMVHGPGPVYAVAASPDGRRVVSGGEDGTARVWGGDADGLTLEGHDGAVVAVAVAPDSRLVASGSLDGTVRLWDATNGAERGVLTGHDGPVFAVAVTPDGRHVVSGSADETVRVWDVASDAAVRVLSGHTGQVMAVVVSADGGRALSGSEDGTLRLWDLASGDSREFAGHQAPVLGVALVPGGNRAVSGAFDQTIRIWDLDRGSATATLAGHYDAIRALVVSPDGRRLASGCFDGSIRIWDLEWCAEVAALTGHAEAVTSLALLPGGRWLVSGSNDGTVRTWDLLMPEGRG